MYKRYWMMKIDRYGFEALFMMYGTEQECQSYMESEFGNILSYHGISEEERNSAAKLGMKCYLAPAL